MYEGRVENQSNIIPKNHTFYIYEMSHIYYPDYVLLQ